MALALGHLPTCIFQHTRSASRQMQLQALGLQNCLLDNASSLDCYDTRTTQQRLTRPLRCAVLNNASSFDCYNTRTKQPRLMRPLRCARHSVTIGFAKKAVSASWTKLMKSHMAFQHQLKLPDECGGSDHRHIRCDQHRRLVASATAQVDYKAKLRRGSQGSWRQL